MFCFLFPSFLKLIVAFRLGVIYVREDNDFNVLAMITRLVWNIWISMSAVLKKAVKLNHSLTTREHAFDFVILQNVGDFVQVTY